MIVRRYTIPLSGLLATAFLLGTPSLLSQDAAFDKSEVSARIAENKKKLEQYTHLQKTEIYLRDRLRMTKVQSIRYDATGTQQVTLVSQDPSTAEQKEESERRMNGGILQRAIEERREEIKDEVKDYIERLTALMKQYLPPDPTRIKADIARADISRPGNGEMTVAFPGYVKPGDKLTLSMDQASKKLQNVSVDSTLDDDPVSFRVAFSQLPDGTNYPGTTTIQSPNKDLRIEVSTYDYHK